MSYDAILALHSESETIAAISTAMGDAGIGIVRLSGDQAIEIVSKIFISASNKELQSMGSHRLTYGHIIDPATGSVIDEVLVSVMRAPFTYTTEDVVEINTHGGTVAVRQVLDAVLTAGARIAQPGEFTKRAFLGGRIDLSQAEAVMDVIAAKSDRGLSMALGQLRGGLKEKVQAIDSQLVSLLVDMEADIDYPEYDIPEVSLDRVQKGLSGILETIEGILKTLKMSRVIKDGLSVAIIGAPNVGKSSLLNAFLQWDKAIVSDIPGTTRDIVEDYLTIEGIPIKLIDTAGIRDSSDVIEQLGVTRSLETLDQADLILFMIDGSRPTSEAEIQRYEEISNKNVIPVVNKTDLPLSDEVFIPEGAIMISVADEVGLDELKQALVRFALGPEVSDKESPVLINARQADAVQKVQTFLVSALDALKMGFPTEIISIDLHNALAALRSITGQEIKDDIVDEIFSRFCLGK